MAQATTATYDHPLPDRYGKALAVAEETLDLQNRGYRATAAARDAA